MKNLWKETQLFFILMGLRPGNDRDINAVVTAGSYKSKYSSLSKNIWVVTYSAPASTFAFRIHQVRCQIGRFRMSG